jgi:type II secretory pathway pseudopilin PulG
MKKQHGFTIVELLAITVLTIILVSFGVATVRGVRQKERNNERQNDIKIVQSHLETYFNQHNKYPSRANLNSATWLKANLKNLDTQALRDPSAANGKLAKKPAANVYSYEVSSNEGKSCNNVEVDCMKYTLTATYEGEGVYVKTNQL